MFGRGVRLFSLFGFDVKVDASWLILALLITWSLAEGFFPYYFPGHAARVYWMVGLAGAVGVFFSIVFHEFSHSLVARRRGMPIRGITLFIFGGVAEMTDEPPSAMTEFLMAAAGPLSSFVLAGLSYVVYLFGAASGWPELASGIFFYFGLLNLILAIFNLVPAFPLDGGRMLRAALWGWRQDIHWATRISSRIGAGFGMVLIFLGVLAVIQGNFIGGLWWFLIGLFLRAAANAGYQQLRSREVLRGEQVSRFMNRSPVVVSPGLSVEELVEDYVYKYHYKMFPVVEGDHLVGCVGTREVKELPRGRWDRTRIDAVMDTCSAENTITPDTDAMDALMAMNRTGSSRMMVVQQGRLVGMLAMRDLMRFLSLKLDLDR